jgi:hypothetical protein
MANWTNPNTQKIVPLFQGGSFTGATNALVIAPGLATVLNKVNISQFESYDLNTYIFVNAPAAGTPIVALINLIWYDDLTSNMPVFEEDWWIWCGRATQDFTNTITPQVASGPMHGRYLTVIINNTGGLSNITVQFLNIFGSNRNVQQSDWRQSADLINPISSGITILSSSKAAQSGYENCLGMLNGISLGQNSTSWLPLSLYAGPVWIRLQITSNAPGADPVISSTLGILNGDITVGTANPNVLTNITADTAEHELQLIFPRTPCYLALKGPAAGAMTVNFIAIGQQGA